MNVFFQQAIGERRRTSGNQSLLKYSCWSVGRVHGRGAHPDHVEFHCLRTGYNVRTLTVIQTPSQLDECYGPNGRKIMLKTLARASFSAE